METQTNLLNQIVVKIFGKKDCEICKMALNKIQSIIKETKSNSTIQVIFFDLDTVDGLTEGSLLNALDVPTIIVEKDGQEIVRWVKYLPGTETIKPYLGITN